MIIGFTGTRYGMNKFQLEQLNSFTLCQTFYELPTVVHGGCIGADEDMHKFAKQLGWRIQVYPGHSSRNANLAERFNYSDADEILPSKTYFARNRDIVDECDLLIAAPPCNTNPGRGGTWYTIAYAQKQGKQVEILLRDKNA